MPSRRTWALLAMWSAAGVAVVFLALARGGESAGRSASEAPVYGPGGERAPSGSRADLSVEPLEPGPPRMFRGDRRHTGRSAHTGPSSGKLAWKYETGDRITAQPVVGPEGRIHVGSLDGFLYVLKPDGTLAWKKKLEDSIYAAAYVDGEGNVYVGSDANIFWALDRSGEVRWKVETGADVDTAPVPSPEGLLHFASGRHLWAVRPGGTVEWRFEARSKIFTTPAVDGDGTVYVGSQDDHVYAVAPDGRMRWSYRTGDDNDSSPVLADDGSLYFGSDDGRVHALTRDGELRWATEVQAYVRAPVAIAADGRVLAGVHGPRPRLVALDRGSGQLQWSFPVTRTETSRIGIGAGPLVDAQGHIYVGAHDDYLYSLTSAGKLRWTFRTDGDIDSNPVLTRDGTLLFGSDDHFLYALNDGD